MRKDLILHLSALSVLLLLELLGIFSDYHQGNFARILVLAAYGVGYNILFGYTGLLSLGHALFFSAGLYASGLSIYHLDYDIGQSIILAISISAFISSLIMSVQRSMHSSQIKTDGPAINFFTSC